jgi:4-diphosphocytidyl-2-C-methyl-D-erythritol kinase
MAVTVKAFAKINLGLRIGPARRDGFHELLTVYQTIGLHDVVQVSVGRRSGIEIRCADPRVPLDESNTCYRIAERAMTVLGAKGRVVIEIDKRLPVQGGLGGASANAVATLLGLERAVRKSLSQTEKLRIAADVGSDLPLFLVGGTVLGVGRGERVFPLPDFPATACVVVTPEIGVSTPKAFAEWDRRQGLKPSFSSNPDAALKRRSSTDSSTSSTNSGKTAASLHSAGQAIAASPTQSVLTQAGTDECVRAYKSVGADDSRKLTVIDPFVRMNELSRGLSAWLSELHSGAPSVVGRGGRAGNPLLRLVRAGIENDFEQVVFPEYPELGEAKRALVRAGAKYASLSGSGSTLYGLFVSKNAAVSAVKKLRKAGWAAQASITLTRTSYWRQIFKT